MSNSKLYRTKETTDYALDYFRTNDIKAEEVDRSFDMLYVWNKYNRQYIYWPTTGSWRSKNSRTGVTYMSKGVEDFDTRFLNN